jgi:hypothetical protein
MMDIFDRINLAHELEDLDRKKKIMEYDVKGFVSKAITQIFEGIDEGNKLSKGNYTFGYPKQIEFDICVNRNYTGGLKFSIEVDGFKSKAE